MVYTISASLVTLAVDRFLPSQRIFGSITERHALYTVYSSIIERKNKRLSLQLCVTWKRIVTSCAVITVISMRIEE
jgi:hypothetical protein